MYKNKKILAVVTARLGSKRLKEKNIIYFKKNKCLLDFTFNASRKSNFLDRVVLSTESKKIAIIAKKIGFEVPFLRSKKFSLASVPAVIPVVDMVKKLKNKYDYIILLQPTSPLRRGSDIDKAIKKMIDFKYQSLQSISKSNKKKKYLINLDKDKTIELQSLMQHQINNKSLINSSKLNSVSFNSKKKYQYYLNGALFISKTKHLLKKKSFISNKTGFYMMPDKRSIDVDTMSDLKKLKEVL